MDARYRRLRARNESDPESIVVVAALQSAKTALQLYIRYALAREILEERLPELGHELALREIKMLVHGLVFLRTFEKEKAVNELMADRAEITFIHPFTVPQRG